MKTTLVFLGNSIGILQERANIQPDRFIQTINTNGFIVTYTMAFEAIRVGTNTAIVFIAIAFTLAVSTLRWLAIISVPTRLAYQQAL